jgi:hypothetical protein
MCGSGRSACRAGSSETGSGAFAACARRCLSLRARGIASRRTSRTKRGWRRRVSVCLSVCLSVYQNQQTTAAQVPAAACLPTCLSVCLPEPADDGRAGASCCLPVCLSVCLSVYLSQQTTAAQVPAVASRALRLKASSGRRFARRLVRPDSRLALLQQWSLTCDGRVACCPRRCPNRRRSRRRTALQGPVKPRRLEALPRHQSLQQTINRATSQPAPAAFHGANVHYLTSTNVRLLPKKLFLIATQDTAHPNQTQRQLSALSAPTRLHHV